MDSMLRSIGDSGPAAVLLPLAVQAVKTCALAVAVLLVFHIVRRRLVDRKFGRIAGEKPSWWNPFGSELIMLKFIGQNMNNGEATLRAIEEFARRYAADGIFRVWLFSVPMIGIAKPQTMELILSSSKHIEKSVFYELLHPWLGTGLLTSGGRKWQSRRKMLTPAFHFRILEDFLPIFNEQAVILARKLQTLHQHKPFDIVKHITNCTLDVICETAMGVRLNAQSNSDSEYVRAVYDVGEIVIQRLTKIWLWPTFIFDLTSEGRKFNKGVRILHDFTNKVIQDQRGKVKARLDEADNNDNERGRGASEDLGMKRRKPFLDLLLERHLTQEDLSLEDIREEVDTFMFEGHDTTAMGIGWTLYLLAENPECQRKVQQELDEIFADDPDRQATTEDIAKMKYLECCIKEAQRLYPSVPFIGRELTEDVHYNNTVLPAGTQAAVFIYGLHRDPETFPDPERFDPDRFLAENCVGRHPYAYVPFSAGPRNCIGQKFALNEEKVVLSWVLRLVSLSTQVLRKDLHICGELVTRSADGLHVTVTNRSQPSK